MNTEEILKQCILNLEQGKLPQIAFEQLPCIKDAISSNPLVSHKELQELLCCLGKDDIPILERALKAYQNGEQAWLGFKLITDAKSAVEPSTEGRWMKKFDSGSADGKGAIFFVDNDRNIMSSREYSKRDRFQMKDCTAGPSMHSEQFPGIIWLSQALFVSPQIVIFGASDVAMYLADYARHVNFDTVVYDDDPDFLNEDRFPYSEISMIDFNHIDEVALDENDYACVLTRGHVHDPESFIHALNSPCYYVGMIGHEGKVATNKQQAKDAGVDPKRIEQAHSPIGIKFGAKTPAEIAVSIIAELIDVRYHSFQKD